MYNDETRPFLIWGAIVAGTALIIWLILPGLKQAAAESEAHQQWMNQHCKLTAHVDGQWAYNFGKAGSYYIPGSDTYKCDNGVTMTESN